MKISRHVFTTFMLAVFCMSYLEAKSANILPPTNIKSIQEEIYQGHLIEDKLYIHSNTVIISEEGFSIIINDQPFPVSSISSDDNGIFIQQIHLVYNPKYKDDWLCDAQYCWQWNNYRRHSCYFCGTPKPFNPLCWGD